MKDIIYKIIYNIIMFHNADLFNTLIVNNIYNIRELLVN